MWRHTLPFITLALAAAACGSDRRLAGPTNVEVDVLSSTSVEIRWQPRQDNTAHRVYVATSTAGLTERFVAVGPGVDSARVDDLLPATTYFFIVRSFQPVLGESLASDVVSATTLPGEFRAPFNLRAIMVASSSVTLAWDNEDPTAEGFRLEQRLGSQSFVQIRELPAAARTTVVQDLQVLTLYEFRIRSFRQDMSSPYSNTETVTTERRPGLGIISVYPPAGRVDGGIPMAIEGWGFEAAPPRVFFGNQPARDIIVVNDTNLSCLAPDGTGTVSVRVESEVGTGMSEGTFAYVGESSPALTIDLLPPSVTFDDGVGVTTVRTAFVARDIDGRPVPADELTTRLFVGSDELGVSNRFNESLLDEQSEALEQNVFLFLTLDASFSLVTQFDTEQFTPMLLQARNLIRSGLDIWGTAANDPMLADDKYGVFLWNVAWFRELIEVSTSTLTANQLFEIPTPTAGNETKMFSAISYHVQESVDRYQAGRAAGPLDRHFVVVFTDGQDTLSWFDNPGVTQSDMLEDGTPTLQFGWPATDLSDVLVDVVEHPLYPARFSMFTVGLGDVDQTPLRTLAQVGLGNFFYDERDIAGLFDRLAAEITEQITRGATLAIEPGAYQFRILVERPATGDTAEAFFTFEGGTPSASVVAASRIAR